MAQFGVLQIILIDSLLIHKLLPKTVKIKLQINH